MKLIELESWIRRHEIENKEEFLEVWSDNKVDHEKIYQKLEEANKILVDIQIKLASKN